jgi:hypothetical protein
MSFGLRHICETIGHPERDLQNVDATLPYHSHSRSLNLELSLVENHESFDHADSWELEGDSYLCDYAGSCDGPLFAALWMQDGPEYFQKTTDYDFETSWDDAASDSHPDSAKEIAPLKHESDADTAHCNGTIKCTHSHIQDLADFPPEEPAISDLDIITPGKEFERDANGVRKIHRTTYTGIGYLFWDVDRLKRWKLFSMTPSNVSRLRLSKSLTSESVREIERHLVLAVRHHFSKHFLPHDQCSPEDLRFQQAFETIESRLRKRYADEERRAREQLRPVPESSG